jgi:hypothetical protein
MQRDAQNALTCPFYFAGFHDNNPCRPGDPLRPGSESG